MKRAVVLAAAAVASVATAQEWRFELSDPVLSPGAGSTTVTLSIDPGPSATAVAGADFSVHASEAGWSDLVALLMFGAPPFGGHPGQIPGVISGGDVTGARIGQISSGGGGWEPRPGRIDVWRGTFTVTDFTARNIDLSTETTRFEVYLNPYPDATRAARTPIEGRGQIKIVPAPAGLALLGLGGVAFAGRRRAEASHCRRDSR